MRYFTFVFLFVCSTAYAQLRVDLMALNHEYVKVVKEKRSQRCHKAVDVQFDMNMFYGTVAHNYIMEEKRDLFHDKSTYNAEMVGTIYDVEEYGTDARKLAEHIFQQFDQSKSGHSEVQINAVYVYVSISCTNGYFCVRMNEVQDSLNSIVVAQAKRLMSKKKGS